MTRRRVLVFVVALLVTCFNSCESPEPIDLGACRACLPEPLTLETEFCESEREAGWREKATTIYDKLIQLGASCRNGKIYDRTGREVRFYVRHLGFGFPPTP